MVIPNIPTFALMSKSLLAIVAWSARFHTWTKQTDVTRERRYHYPKTKPYDGVRPKRLPLEEMNGDNADNDLQSHRRKDDIQQGALLWIALVSDSSNDKPSQQ